MAACVVDVERVCRLSGVEGHGTWLRSSSHCVVSLQDDNFAMEAGRKPITFENPMYTTMAGVSGDPAVIHATQVCVAQVRLAQVCVTQVCATQVHLTQVHTTQVRLTQVCAT